MTDTALKVQNLEGVTFYRTRDGEVIRVDDGDNDGHYDAEFRRHAERISQVDYWIGKLRQAREERDRAAIEAILNKDDFVEKAEGWIDL